MHTFSKAPADGLLLALKDLYSNWLDEAGKYEQARALYQRHRGSIIEKAGTRAAGLMAEILGLGFEGGSAVARAFDKFFGGLRDANKDLRTGGLDLKIPYEEAIELVTALSIATEQRPMIVALDAWDQSINPANDAGPLRRLFGEIARWPAQFHVLISVRDHDPEDAAHVLARELAMESPGSSVIKLSEWDISGADEQAQVLKWAREHVPASRSVGNETLVKYMAGSPAVLNYWKRGEPKNTDDLRKLSRQAHQVLYKEVPARVAKVFGQASPRAAFKLLVRLAALPEFTTQDDWRAISDVVLAGSDEPLLELQGEGFLVIGAWPRFRHTTYYEAVRAEVLRDGECSHAPYAAREIDALAVALAEKIQDVNDGAEPFARNLASLRDGQDIKDTRVLRLIVGAARSLLEGGAISSHANEVQEFCASHPRCAPLIVMGVLNSLHDAKGKGDLPRRDAMLQQLRQLSVSHRADGVVREWWANSLLNAINHAKEEKDLPRRDAFFEELQKLSAAHIGDEPVRGYFATGVFNTLLDAQEEGNPLRRDAMLEELKKLNAAYPNDVFVRERLVMALANAASYLKKERSLARRDVLIDELRKLGSAHSGDAAVREWLAKGLLKALVDAHEEGQVERRTQLLEELRLLINAHPADEYLAKTLKPLIDSV